MDELKGAETRKVGISSIAEENPMVSEDGLEKLQKCDGLNSVEYPPSFTMITEKVSGVNRELKYKRLLKR